MIPHHFILEYILDYIEKTSHISDSFFILHTKSIRLETTSEANLYLGLIFTHLFCFIEFRLFLCVTRRFIEQKEKH